MFAPIPQPPISQSRKALALTIAGCADMVQLFLLPLFIEGAASPFEVVVDIATAILLTAVCGFKWQFVLAFFMELVPGLDLFPTWSAVALLIPSTPNTIEVFRTPGAPPVQQPSLYPPIETTAVVVPPVQGRPVQG